MNYDVLSEDVLSEEVIEAALYAQREYKVPASILLAQYILDSDFGRNTAEGSNNPFNVKAGWKQPFVIAPTHELLLNRWMLIQGKFKKYSNIKDAFLEHARMLAEDRPFHLIKIKMRDPESYARGLTSLYQGDEAYGDNLVYTMREYNLFEFDRKRR